MLVPPFARHDEIHIWHVQLESPDVLTSNWFRMLPEHERERVNSFYFDQHRIRWINARIALRQILGGYLGTMASAVTFRRTAHGKPYLDPQIHQTSVHFNLADSEDLAIVAVTPLGPVGVDVEYVREIPDAMALAERFLCEEEVVDLTHVGPVPRPAAFYNCWTRKEAFIKAIGSGLSFPLDRFRVSVLPQDQPRIHWILGSEAEARNWRLFAFSPAQDYVGALAIRTARECNLKHFFFARTPQDDAAQFTG